MNLKDILIRAIKTFIQGFLGSLAVILPTIDITDLAIVKSALIGALAAGISALMNSVTSLYQKKRGIKNV